MRVFNGYAVAAFDEHAGHEIERLLRAVDDDHFGWIAYNGARAAQVIADGFAQDEASNSIAVVELAHGRHAHVLQQDSTPALEGEGLDVAASVGEVVAYGFAWGLRSIDCGHRVNGCCAEARQTELRRSLEFLRCSVDEAFGDKGT